MDLDINEDGSVDIYFGPKAPRGKEKNWIPTNAGEGWFSYFRLYGPTQDHFDLKWVLPDIEKANWDERQLTSGCSGRRYRAAAKPKR